MTSKNIKIAIEDERWHSAIDNIEAITDESIQAVFEYCNIKYESEVSIVFANNDFVQPLNRDYRGKDKPTNVLSFPQSDDDHTVPTPLLGDIILAYETINTEAKEHDKSFSDHTRHLLIHGTLHLLGYDHETDNEAEEMEAIEIEILQKFDIKNPYETDKAVS